jgi:hypothetical protein
VLRYASWHEARGSGCAVRGYGHHVSRFFAYARSYALEHYEDLADIKCAIVHTNVLQPEVCVFVSQN